MTSFSRRTAGMTSSTSLKIITLASVLVLATGSRTSAAPVPVVLKFDSTAPNSFLNAINAAAVSAGLGANYFPAGDVPLIETGIQNELTTVYNGLNLQFTTTATANARTETFADNTGQNVFGLAPFNWRNAFLANTSSPANDAAITAQIFSSKFGDSLSAAAGTTVAQNETRLAIGIGDTGAY